MRLKGLVSTLAAVCLLQMQAYCQDKIYTALSSTQAKILAINETTVTYKTNPASKATLKLPIREVVLLFNQNGGYITSKGFNWKDPRTRQVVQSFLKQQSVQWPADVVINGDRSSVEGTITAETNDAVSITSATGVKQLPKKSIALIIYRNGKHATYTSANIVSDLLNELRGPAGAISKPPVALVTIEPTPAKPLAIDDLLTPIQKSEFEQKAKEKTYRFSNYLKILCDRSNPTSELNNAIDLALELFINDSADVETSSLNREVVQHRKIKRYLNDLKIVKYDHIELEWSNVQYVSDLRRAPDGTYRGTVTFQQTFKGFKDGALQYKDITTKTAEIILKTYKKVVEGTITTNWDILLGNIGVTETKKLLNP